MPTTVRSDVLEFLNTYQRGADTDDPDIVRECFADTFLNLDPRTAGPVPREALIQALPDRARLFGSIGVERLELTGVSESPLDEHHTMVTTEWTARFTADATDAGPLTLPSHFLLRRQNSGWQIVAYLSSTDLTEVFSRRAPRHEAGRLRDAGPAGNGQ